MMGTNLLVQESKLKDRVGFSSGYCDVQSASFVDSPVEFEYKATKNPKFRDRCGCDDFGTCNSEWHGKSYISIAYGGKYDMVIHLNHYGLEYYGTESDAWEKFIHAPNTYHLWTSPKGNGGAGFFYSGNNDTPGEHTGALGVEIFEKESDQQLWWGLWYFSEGFGNDWGQEWLRCGHDYDFWFKDK
ncbi:hypothetical protein ACFPYJ_07760 [Paenibacillus solisilvae]|uniref:Uncharacterized protein n=1 Tax=Paenibacillus solisilvae TaxID=2486751 RepID=A0ABW0VT54_9BACL